MVIPIIDQSYWKNKKVFLTGHTGFKGSWLSSILLHAGAIVTGYALSHPNKPNLYEILNLSAEMSSINGDIRDIACLQKALNSAKPDIVFHLAAQPIVRESYNNPVYTYETNVMGTVNILECIRQYGNVRSFVNVTTDKVYENNEWYWGYRENDRLCGQDPYSNSKSCSELITSSYSNSFFRNSNLPAISTARSGNVIGGGDFAADRIIPDCVRAVTLHENIIVRNSYSIRPYQHVLDCLSGYLLLAQKQDQNKDKYEGSYNFGPDEMDCINTGVLVDEFCKKWGPEAKWVSVSEEGPYEATTLKLDCSKAKTVLGWKPAYSIETAVEMTVEWYQAFYNDRECKAVTSNQINKYWS
ncbi:CDP-glucose 4,6-dehydratase [Paenibacillus sp. TAB 01]|uniref:CDP-glucose 4,6-dehydratase n=1 Tax=Paenibacillus sp. TAB 01 TaxID=3368988 RepID=UPI0037539C85